MVEFAFPIHINGSRLQQRLDHLAQIGARPDGGVRRIAYSPEDQLARQQVITWMHTLDMTVRIDAAGNIIGRFPGSQPDLPALATGSHIDTVPSGGRYDGCYGVLAGLEVVETLREKNIHLRHDLEVLVFTDEEGSLIGSQAMSGHVHRDPEYYRRPDGTDIATCLAQIGGNWAEIGSARRSPSELAAFVELHVEQGPVLESAGISIGLVTGIVGQRRYQITLTGRANHAGTTPMSLRQDALVAAAQVILAVHDIGTQPGDHVATVGQVRVYPNAPNVVPGKVELSLDIRDLSSTHLEDLVATWKTRLTAIAQQTGIPIQVESTLTTTPAPAHPRLQILMAEVCQRLGLSSMSLPSRASHDAQEMAHVTPMGMIFVPSRAGVSHDHSEYTSPQECAQGADVLLHTLLTMDDFDVF